MDAGADPNAQGEDDYSPLHHAASYDSPPIVMALLEAGGDPELRNSYGETPKEYSRMSGNSEVIALFEKPSKRAISQPRD